MADNRDLQLPTGAQCWVVLLEGDDFLGELAWIESRNGEHSVRLAFWTNQGRTLRNIHASQIIRLKRVMTYLTHPAKYFRIFLVM